MAEGLGAHVLPVDRFLEAVVQGVEKDPPEVWEGEQGSRAALVKGEQFSWVDKFHPAALLHRRVAELGALEMHKLLGGVQPQVPAKIDLQLGASAAGTVAAWVAAGGEE